MKDQERDEQLTRGADVLEEADGGELQAAESRTEHEHRHGSEDAGQRQNAQGGGRDGVERDDGELRHGNGEQNGRFNQQAVQGVNIDLLAHEPVESEGAGEGHGDPGEARAAQGQVCDSEGGDGDGHPLPAAEAFAEEHHAQGDGEQRVDEVTEAGFQHLVTADGVDEDQPVKGNENAAEGQE